MTEKDTSSKTLKAIMVITTAPSQAVAQELSQNLVSRRLAACVTQLGQAVSTYYWQGRQQTDEEFPLLIKTTEALYPAVEKFLMEHHPYEVPECIALPIVDGAKGYLAWIYESVGS